MVEVHLTILVSACEYNHQPSCYRRDSLLFKVDYGQLGPDVAAKKGLTLSVSLLCGFLQATLPEYIAPAVFAMLGALPLTFNGKVGH